MLLSIAYMLMVGMFLGWCCKKMKLPGLLGMILTGILLGPYMFNRIDSSILEISPELRRIALIIILTRAGLSLELEDLKKAGRPALLMCFVPACFEILGMVLIAPMILGVTRLEAAIIGSVVAAVSPAVIVPKMIRLIDERRGTDQKIPQMILAGASVDDVFVIVLFTAFTGMAQGGSVSVTEFVKLPVTIGFGMLAGFVIGTGLAAYFKRIHIRDTAKVMIVMSVNFILVSLEDMYGAQIPFSGLLAVVGVGIALQKKHREAAKRLSVKFNKLWVAAEILLFALVGATVDLGYAAAAGAAPVVLIMGGLVFRGAGVLLSVSGSGLSWKERLFCVVGYMPKATVQAAIGGLPLAMGLSCGNLVLTVAVFAILITAPLGAFLIDLTAQGCLKRGR